MPLLELSPKNQKRMIDACWSKDTTRAKKTDFASGEFDIS